MKKILAVTLFAFMFLSFNNVVFAEETPIKDAYDLNDALKYLETDKDGKAIDNKPKYLPGVKDSSLEGNAADITMLLQRFGNAIASLAAAIAVIFMVQNGFTIVTAAGDTEKISKAKKGIIWALVGLLLIIGSYIVVKTIISVTYGGQEISSQ